MATIHFRNAYILINGASLAASFSELNVEHGCETLDDTTFGETARTNKGGLKTATISGKGYLELGSGGIEDIVFSAVGVDNTVLAVFANGITEGTITDRGFAMLGVVNTFNIGGTVGTLLPFDFSAAGRGLLP